MLCNTYIFLSEIIFRIKIYRLYSIVVKTELGVSNTNISKDYVTVMQSLLLIQLSQRRTYQTHLKI